MPVNRLEIENLRLYRQAVLEPDARANLIVGENASGKTTLLEALHLLGTGRSFRTGGLDSLQAHHSDFFRVGVEFQAGDTEPVQQLSFARQGNVRRLTVNGLEQANLSGLAQQIPVQIISPDGHFDFQHDAKVRRALLDWLLFHVEPEFQGLWSRYQRTLHQRNAALKDPRQVKVRFAWDNELAILGDELQQRRMTALQQLLPHFQIACTALFATPVAISLELSAGWDQSAGLAESLRQDRGRDQARGFTHSGPHRNDLRIWLGEHASREEASHGQNKLLVIALRLAEIQVLLEVAGRQCCLLIDDLPAELDREHRRRLAEYLATIPTQVFVTSTDPTQIDLAPWPSARTFHVERGTLCESRNT